MGFTIHIQNEIRTGRAGRGMGFAQVSLLFYLAHVTLMEDPLVRGRAERGWARHSDRRANIPEAPSSRLRFRPSRVSVRLGDPVHAFREKAFNVEIG